MDYVAVSRNAAQLKNFLSTSAMQNLVTAIQAARSFDDLDPLYQSWLQDRANVSYRYLSNTAKLAIKQRRGQSV